MPLYEYRCTSCEDEFEELVFGDEVPDCPKCGAGEPKKLMSAHNCGKTRGRAAPAVGPCGNACGHPDGPGACAR